jgi:siroheme synthase-like protein
MDGEKVLLNVDMSGKAVIVLGGGNVALRKAKILLAAGAEVRVVAPDLLEEIEELGKNGTLSVIHDRYEAAYLEGMFLAVAATDDAWVNHQVSADAASQGKMVCVADAPEIGDCTFPAVLRHYNIEIAVSTGGTCPSLAVELRDIIASVITEEYGYVADRLAKEREKLLTEGSPSTYNATVLRSLARRLISELNERRGTGS